MCIFSKYELLGKKIKLSSYKISGVGLEDQMVGWHHRLNGYDFEQAPGIGDGQVGWRAAVHTVAKSRTRLSD